MARGKRAVVVGAGAVGIAAARLLARQGAAVTLIDPARAIGGAWRAFEAEPGADVEEQGLRFDRGFRVGESTGDARLDHALFGSLDLEWRRSPGYAREGHVVGGRLSTHARCPDARAFGEAVAARALIEIHGARPDALAVDLAATLRARFGPTLTETLYRPAFHKLFGVDLETLAPEAGRGRIPSRVTLTDHGQTERHLRESSALRARLAHPSSRGLRAPGQATLVPARGPAEGWIRAGLADLARDPSVSVRPGARLASVRRRGASVDAVILDGGELIPTSCLVWTRSAASLLRATHLATATPRLPARDVALVHLVADVEPATDVVRAQLYDEPAQIASAVFYRELRPAASALERRAVTCEVLLDPHAPLDERALSQAALAELCEVGLMPAGARLERAWFERFSGALPIPTVEVGQADQRARLAVGELTNVALLPGGSDAPLRCTLRAADREVSRLLGTSPLSRAA